MKFAPRWPPEELKKGILQVYKDFNPPRSMTFLSRVVGMYWQNNRNFPRMTTIILGLGLPLPKEDGARPYTWQERAAIKEGGRRLKERRMR